MSSPAVKPTPYPYVNEALQLFLTEVQAVLKDNFLGLYLHGSLAAGDFDPEHSDIDFLVVTKKELPKKLIPELETMHRRIYETGPSWAKKLEGTYYSLKTLWRWQRSKRQLPYFNEGKYFLTQQGIDWIINRYILREKGIAVAGPPIRPLIAPISSKEIKWAVAQGIIEDWSSRTEDRSWLEPDGHQSFVVVTCCRALYTLKYGVVKSKLFSAKWGLKNLDSRWHPLIKHAISWQHGQLHADIGETLEMMKFTIEECKKYLG